MKLFYNILTAVAISKSQNPPEILHKKIRAPVVRKRGLYIYSVLAVVVKIALNKNNGGALVAGAGGKVAQGTDQVGQLSGSGTLGCHIADEIVLLFTD